MPFVTLLCLEVMSFVYEKAPLITEKQTPKFIIIRLQVLAPVKISILIAGVLMPCGLEGRYQRFRGTQTYCQYLQGCGPKAARFSKTFVSTCMSTRRYNEKDQQINV
jgi:hypothetical protein